MSSRTTSLRASILRALSYFPTSSQSLRMIGSSETGGADSAEDIVESQVTVVMADPATSEEIVGSETENAAAEAEEETSAVLEDGATDSMTAEDARETGERSQVDGEAAGQRSLTGFALAVASTGSDKLFLTRHELFKIDRQLEDQKDHLRMSCMYD
mmetsp:Transcript_13639/g.31396  ORF Transcript_13639/g.31396 Transcript_13639/m.31396 type:complete len:157 (-) Transcript_13639:15-485(-)